MFVLAPYFLRSSATHYVEEGTWTLRVLALATVAAAFNYWGMIRLRLSSHLPAMILVQLRQHGGDARPRRFAGARTGRSGSRRPGVSATWSVGSSASSSPSRSRASPTTRATVDEHSAHARCAMRNLAPQRRPGDVLRILRVTLRSPVRVVPQTPVRCRSRCSRRPRATGSRWRARSSSGTPAGSSGSARRGPLPAEVRTPGFRQGMALVPKASLARVFAYLRAEAVFFTHGLYGSPRPCRSKPIVNLWHGDGPKDSRPTRTVGALISSTYFVGEHPALLGPSGRGLRRPRRPGAAHRQPAHRPALATRRPRAARRASASPATSWCGCRPSAGPAVGAVRSCRSERPEDGRPRGARRAPRRPARSAAFSSSSSRTRWTPTGGAGAARSPSTTRTWCARGEPLRAARLRPRGLVTDYSSVWVDYLLLDRPIAFLVPDRDSYDRALFPADVLDWVPGEVVDLDDQPFADVLRRPRRRRAAGSAQRREVAERIGLNREPDRRRRPDRPLSTSWAS